MSRNIQEKLAKGRDLSDDDVQYAVERGIELPEEYGVQVASVKMDLQGAVPLPVVQTGPAFASAGNGEGASMDALRIVLNAMPKKQLVSLAAENDLDVDTKAHKEDLVEAVAVAMVEQATGVEPEEDDDQDDESGGNE